MTITAKFSSTCPTCRQSIEAGDRVEWSRGSAARHLDCQAFVAPQLSEEDPEFGREDPRSPHICPRHGNSRSFLGQHDGPCLRPATFDQARQADTDDESYDAWIAATPDGYREYIPEEAPRAAAPAARTLTVEDAGVYVLADGSIVNLKATRDHQRTYAELWTVIGGRRLTEAEGVEHGEYVYNEDWQARRDLSIRVATEGRKLTLDEAKAFSIRFGVCVRCAAALSDALSVKLGIGSTCIKYVDFDPEAVAAAKAEVKAALKAAKTKTEPSLPAIVDPSTLEDDLQARKAAWLKRKGF